MSFAYDVGAWSRKVRTQQRAVFVRTAELVHESVVDGSPVTGAPGQPVDTGKLKNSFALDIKGNVATISTNVEYAPIIEHNLRGATLRSAVGGFHSVALTVAGFEGLVAQAVKEVGDA